MLRPIGPPATLSIAKTRAIVKDLFTPQRRDLLDRFSGIAGRRFGGLFLCAPDGLDLARACVFA